MITIENVFISFFLLDKDEKVYKVQVISEDTPYWQNDSKIVAPMVRGIRLFTTKGCANPSIDYGEGIKVTEQFDGYTVSYVSGRLGLYVDQIQLHWHRIEVDEVMNYSILMFQL